MLAPSNGGRYHTVLAKNACDGGGYGRFVFIKRSEGNVVAVTGRHADRQEHREKHHRELQEAIEFINAKQSRLLATLSRKQKFMSGAPEEIRLEFTVNEWRWTLEWNSFRRSGSTASCLVGHGGLSRT